VAAPRRGDTGHSCYFITGSTFRKQQLFQSERMALLFLDVLFHYRAEGRFLLHEFVIMPDHFHLLISPVETLERTLQLVRGGFSYRARKELGYMGEIWQTSYYDRRVRDFEEYKAFRYYIHTNPLKKKIVNSADEYAYSSAHRRFAMDPVPQRLKPIGMRA